MIVELSAELGERLVAAARSRGVTIEDLAREAVLAYLSLEEEDLLPARSLKGLLAGYGPAPSEEEIAENRREMLANFPRSDS